MLRVAALLSAIIWIIGWQSGFFGLGIHIFLLLALLAVLASFLPGVTLDDAGDAPPDAGSPRAREVATPDAVAATDPHKSGS